MRTFFSNLPRWQTFLWMLPLVAAAACGGDPDGNTNPGGSGGQVNPGGSGGDENPGGSGGSGNPGGSGGDENPGGSGGTEEPVICEQDCSAIETGACEVAVCNDGTHEGPVGECVIVMAPNDTTCDDGLFCTVGDTCVEGVCTGTAPNDCGMEGTQCSDVVCDEDKKSCHQSPVNEGESCDDGLFCTIGDTCIEGVCTGAAPNDCGIAGTECTSVVCDEEAGSCSEVPANEGGSCDDGLFCTVGDSCVEGVCTGAAPNDCGMEGTQCTAIVCDEKAGTCSEVPANEGDTCDDGLFCTVGDTCVEGSCTPSGTNDCGLDGSACAEVVCDETSRSCDLAPINEGGSCDDGLFCTAGDTCVAGECVPDQANDCGLEATACTSVACDESARACDIVPSNEGNPCDDGLFCTVGDTCVAGQCVSDQANDCGLTGSFCSLVACDEGSRSCDLVATNEGQSCGTNPDLCLLDTCVEGSCVGLPKDCSASDTACGVGTCDPADGRCLALPVAEGTTCGDVGCGTGACDAAGSCILTSMLPDGTTCAASSRCLTDGICVDGGCYESDACRTYYFEDFTGCPGTWTSIGPWECGTPTSGPGSAFSGAESFGTHLAGDYPPNLPFGQAWLQSPTIDLTGTNEPELQFSAWVRTEANWDGFRVLVSGDGGETFELPMDVYPPYGTLSNSTSVGEGGPAWSGTATEWQPYRVNLSRWAGGQVILRFDFRADHSTQHAGVYIDDLYVQEVALWPMELSASSFQAYENVPFSIAPTAIGGSTDRTWMVVGGANHGWLSVDPSSGEIAGTPGAADLGRGFVRIRVMEPSAPWNFDEADFPFLVVPTPFFLDDFEVCSGWTFGPEERAATDWACGPPTSGPGSAYEGQNVLATGLGGNYASNMAVDTHFAMTPAIVLPAGSNPLLTFRAWLRSEANYDGLNVAVSTDGGLTFVTPETSAPAMGTLTGSGGLRAWSGTAQSWGEYLVDLSPWSGQTVHVRLGFRSDTSSNYAGVYIDDFKIIDASARIMEIHTSRLAQAYVGLGYLAPLSKVNGGSNVHWEIVSGADHEWLSIDPATGTLSGTPTNPGVTTVLVRVTHLEHRWNTVERTFTIEVGPAALFADSFEDCSQWTLAPQPAGTGDWMCGVPTTGPGSALDGDHVLATGLAANYGSNMRPDTHFALSPVIDLSFTESPTLTFRAWSHTENNWDGMVVHVTTDGGSTYELVPSLSPLYRRIGGTTAGTSGWSGDRRALGWEEYVLDLSPWEGERIQVRFGFNSDGSLEYPGFFIDKLAVFDGPHTPIRIDPKSHTHAFVGMPYTMRTEYFGGTSNVRWSLDPTAPTWLSIDPMTGLVTGVPPTHGDVTFTVRATEPSVASNQAEQTFTLTIRNPIFLDGFEDCEAGGWVLAGGWECGVPTSGPDTAERGSNVIATNLAGRYSSGIVWGTWTATTRPIALPTPGQPILLEFSAWIRTETCCDGFNVQVSTDGGENWQVAPAVGPSYGSGIGAPSLPAWKSNDAMWTRHVVDLSTWAGQTVLVRFDFRSDGSTEHEGVYIDDLSISY